MKHNKELELIYEYINNFDASEFSSSADSLQERHREEGVRMAEKIKARLRRKQQMEKVFKKSFTIEAESAETVMITQEEIDNLLAMVDC